MTPMQILLHAMQLDLGYVHKTLNTDRQALQAAVGPSQTQTGMLLNDL